MEERELQWANPTDKFSLQKALTRALDYLRILLSSKDHTHCLSPCQKLIDPHGSKYSIASRCITLMGQDWGSLPNRPSPLAKDNATKQLSIESSLSKRAAALAAISSTHRTRILLNFPAKEKSKIPSWAGRRQKITAHHHRTPQG